MTKPHDPIPREALARAVEVVGSRTVLARRLGVALEELESWLRGDVRPPSKVVFAALALVEGNKTGT